MQGELILYIPARLSSFTCVSKDDVLCFNEVFIYIRSFFFSGENAQLFAVKSSTVLASY